ncbi:hypothetical protein R1sor_022672 [Riccia sorocarpa]|uniref:Mitochondrial import inner membrane translocase subunit TIM50 n=1 Tax=Riccia sorocarpa TaxID=122646 RepID=A0ABD3GM20_9MARC
MSSAGLMQEMDSLAPMHTEFIELANIYEETRAQYMAMQESLKAQWDEEQRLLQATREMQAMMAKVRQSDQGLPLRVQELKAERSRLEDWIKEHQLVKKDLEEALSLARPPINPRRKTLVLDINGLLMKVGRSRSDLVAVEKNGYDVCGTAYVACWFIPRPGMAGFLRRCLEWFNVILWTSRTERNLAVLVRACTKRGMFPGNFQNDHGCTIDHSICERDVLLLDDSVQKNSTNHPYQALHPRTFDPMKTAKKDDNYLSSVLLPVLDKLRFHREDVTSFVEANWQAVQAQEPFGKLAAYWGTIDARDDAFLWSNCKASDRYVFKGRLDEHRIKQAVQTATDLVTAEENWPSQNPDEAGPSQRPDSELAELGSPLVPAPLTRAEILSETEILLSGSRDEDEELVRLHGDFE